MHLRRLPEGWSRRQFVLNIKIYRRLGPRRVRICHSPDPIGSRYTIEMITHPANNIADNGKLRGCVSIVAAATPAVIVEVGKTSEAVLSTEYHATLSCTATGTTIGIVGTRIEATGSTSKTAKPAASTTWRIAAELLCARRVITTLNAR